MVSDFREVVALIGAGAIGTVLGHELAASGHTVVVCGRAKLERLAVTRDDGTREQPVKWVATPEELPPVRWAVLATKIGATPDVADWLARLDRDATVVVAQNGIDHVARVSAFTEARVVPTVVYVNSERVGPGHARTRATGRGLTVPDDEGGQAVARLFSQTRIPVTTVSDFTTASWEKLLINTIANPLTTLTGRRMGVFANPSIRALAVRLADEVAAVARAEGATLTDELIESVIDHIRSLPPDTPTSMLQDRNAGRPLEHEGLLGPVITLSERHGIPMPATRTILALLGALPIGDEASRAS